MHKRHYFVHNTECTLTWICMIFVCFEI